MRHGTQTPQLGPSQRELDALTKWSIAVLVLVALLTTGYSIMFYAARIEETRTQLESNLPGNYRETLQAILLSADARCPKVCNLIAANVAPYRTAFKVSCGEATASGACAASVEYLLTLEPSPVPSR